MKKSVIVFLTFFAALVANPVVFSQDIKYSDSSLTHQSDKNEHLKPQKQNPEEEMIIQSAKKQIKLFIDNIPDEKLQDYGLKNREEFDKITFDIPVKVFTLKDSSIVFTSTWRIPIVIDNEYRALLTATMENKEYKIVDFGARVLAKELFIKKTNQTMGMLRVYELKSDFLIEVFPGGQLKFLRIQQGEKEKLYDMTDIFIMIQTINP